MTWCRRRFDVVAVVLAAAVGPATLEAQEQEPPQAPVAQPEVVTGGAATGVSATVRELDLLRSTFVDRSGIEVLEERLRAVEDRLSELVPGETGAAIENAGRDRIEDLLLRLPRYAAEAEALGGELGTRLTEASEVRTRIEGIRGSWAASLEDPDDDLPQELTDAIENLLNQASAGLNEARDRIGELIAMEGRALTVGQRIASLESAARARERALLGSLLEQESDPLWSAMGEITASEMRSSLARVPADIRAGLRDLSESFRGRIFLHGLLGLIVLAGVFGMRRSSALAENQELDTTRRILGRPVAVTAVLTLALTQSLYPTALPGVIALNTVLFLAAELVVLQAALPTLPARLLWGGGGFLALTRLAYLLPYDTVTHRLAFLGAAVGTAILLLAVRGFIRRDESVSILSRKVSDPVLILLASLLGLAVLANVAGLVGLAVTATSATIRSVFSGLGVLTLVIALRELVQAVLLTGALNRLRSVRLHRRTITESVWRTLALAGGLSWTWATLAAFRIADPVAAAVGRLFDAQIRIGEAEFAPGSIVIFGASVWLAVYVSRMTRFFLDEDVLPRLSLPRGVPGAISTGVHYTIIALALAFGVTAMGLDFSSLTLVVGALGVGIGFGLQNIINNFISGLILLFERPIQVGDEVSVGQLMGTVRRIGIRASVVRTYDGSEVIVPNGDLISQQVINYTLSDRLRRLELIVGVAYGSDLEVARAAIAAGVASVERIIADPEPVILFRGFGESSLDFRIFFWVADFSEGLPTSSELGMAINRELKEAGIEIPFPQRDLHLRSFPADGSIDPRPKP